MGQIPRSIERISSSLQKTWICLRHGVDGLNSKRDNAHTSYEYTVSHKVDMCIVRSADLARVVSVILQR